MQNNSSYACSRTYQLQGPLCAQVNRDYRVRWLVITQKIDCFLPSWVLTSTVLVKSINNWPKSRDLLVLFIHWFHRLSNRSWTCTSCTTDRTEVRKQGSTVTSFFLSETWFPYPKTVGEVFANMFRWLQCVLLQGTSVPSNFVAEILSFTLISDDTFYGTFCWGPAKVWVFGSARGGQRATWWEYKRGILLKCHGCSLDGCRFMFAVLVNGQHIIINFDDWKNSNCFWHTFVVRCIGPFIDISDSRGCQRRFLDIIQLSWCKYGSSSNDFVMVSLISTLSLWEPVLTCVRKALMRARSYALNAWGLIG